MSPDVTSLPDQPDQPAEPPRPRLSAGADAAELARALGAPAPLEPIRLSGVTLDSRSVETGDLWCALPGANAHGAQFAAQARERGAALALTDAAGRPLCERAGLPALVVADPRRDTAAAASLVYGHPGRRLATVGVTGTNGKTSVTTMIDQTLRALGRATGVVGTSGTAYRDSAGRDHHVATVRTTPEAPELHGILARIVEDGVHTASMEISSHALVLHRADGVVVDVACFTNLSQDHLDFHRDMEDYYRAKRSMLTPAHARRAVVCVDGDWGRRLAREAEVPVVTYATDPAAGADHTARDLRADGYGTVFTADGPRGSRTLRSALPGRHFVANALAASLLLEEIGIAGPQVDHALGTAGTVPGRMEPVAEAPVLAVVDYSHTPDALEQALTTLRAVPRTRRLIAVIGAGGDRDRGKRPRMGEVTARLADVVIVTDDNPRTEDPSRIRSEVLSGIAEHSKAEVREVSGRGEAIVAAARLADVGDTILLAGKGAETGQEIGGIVHPFDDRLRLRDALTTHGGDTDADHADGGR